MKAHLLNPKRIAWGACAVLALVATMRGAAATTITQSPEPTPLGIGGSVAPLANFPSEVNLVTEYQMNFASANGPSGMLTEVVTTPFVGTPAPGTYSPMPYGPSGMVFAFQLALSSDDVAEVAIPGFAGYLTSVKVCSVSPCTIGAGGVVPTSASRSGASDGGNVITFDFTNPVTSSSAFDIYTNASLYSDPPDIQIIDTNGNVSTVAGFFGPAGAPVPEPATWALLLPPLGAAWLLARRRVRSMSAGAEVG